MSRLREFSFWLPQPRQVPGRSSHSYAGQSMSKLALGCLGLFWSMVCCAQSIPSVLEWRGIFEEVRGHALFRELDVRYAKAPAENVGYTPVGVLPNRHSTCAVVIAEGDNPKMQAIMDFGSNPDQVHTLLVLAAAHELGHCLRVRHKQMSPQFWALVAATDEGSPQRRFMERQASLEEAYADAYALVYVHDISPQRFGEALRLMTALRTDPYFETPMYQVRPLYDVLARHGLDNNLPLQHRVESIVQQARFRQN